jgi:hypothetical protein
MSSSYASHLAELLWAPAKDATPLERYALLDAARHPRVYPLVRYEAGASCLYEGPVPTELLEVAPYLLRLEREAPVTRELLTHGWGQAWGLFIEAPVAPALLRRHLRRFLKVRSEEGQRLYFRFYDPRVLRTYLPTCTAEELQFVFGPIRSFLMEDADGSALLRFSLSDAALQCDRIPLEPDAAAPGPGLA